MRYEFTSTKDFFAHAKKQTTNLTLFGMIKPGSSEETVYFTPSSCDSWVELKASEIERLDYMGEKPCRKAGEEPHTHSLARLTMMEGTKDLHPELSVISQLMVEVKTLQKALQSIKQRSASPLDCDEGTGACGQTPCDEDERPCYDYDGTSCIPCPY